MLHKQTRFLFIRKRYIEDLIYLNWSKTVQITVYRRLQYEASVKLLKNNINKNEETIIVVEQVNAMPGQGVTSMFNFGQTFGAIKGICAALGLPIYFVRPAKWKKHFELINSSKDSSRTKAIEMYPLFSENLSKKKDVNKSDAILIARFYSETRFKEDPK